MTWINITEKEKKEFNSLATHPLQSYEWGEFRQKTGITVIRKGFLVNKKLAQAFQLTIHPIPHTPWNIGYLPKGTLPTKELLEELQRISIQYKCIFIQLEPNVTEDIRFKIKDAKIRKAAHPLFTKYTLTLDLTKSDEELLKAMHPKARYNIKVALKHRVSVKEENTKKAFTIFWNLTQQTTSRHQFYAHTKMYHQLQWETLPHTALQNTLSSHLLLATYQEKILTAWIVFVFKDTLYYPYGASSNEDRQTMHSTLMMWEAIKFGKKYHLQTFDLWGAAAANTPSSDPWYGFTKFKERFGPRRIEYIGSYDLIINPLLYKVYTILDKLRWFFLKLRN